MARKSKLLDPDVKMAPVRDKKAVDGVKRKGAAGMFGGAMDEVKAALAGEAIVDIDPSALERSFVTDRFDEDDGSFAALKASIAEKGQESPILVRPIEGEAGRYRIVFGHRRARAAKELGMSVKAIVRKLDSDDDHIVIQGQENSARENLTFVEKAMFAKELSNLKKSNELVMNALSIDKTMLSHLNKITKTLPVHVIKAIGRAGGIGRVRWQNLAAKAEKPSVREKIETIVSENGFTELEPEEKFARLEADLERVTVPKRIMRKTPMSGQWQAGDDSVKAEYKANARSYWISLKATDANKFGKYISDNLDRLHDEFSKQEEEGEN